MLYEFIRDIKKGHKDVNYKQISRCNSKFMSWRHGATEYAHLVCNKDMKNLDKVLRITSNKQSVTRIAAE